MKMDDEPRKIAEDYERRQRLSPAALNKHELAKGHRWTLLQSIAWVATRSQAYVDLVDSYTSNGDALYPDPQASQKASLEVARLLRELSAPALSFPLAQARLFKLLHDGEVTIYVDHQPFSPAGLNFTHITHRGNCSGLAPAQNSSYWDYVVVDAESLQLACPDETMTGTPADAPAGESAAARRSDKSGGQGRPTSMHIIAALLEDEAKAGRLAPTLIAQATELQRLFEADPENRLLAHPTVPTIENGIRARYRQLKADKGENPQN